MPQTRGSCGHIRAAGTTVTAAFRVPNATRTTAALSVGIGQKKPGPSSVDHSRAGNATCVAQVKVGKVRLAVTFPHTTSTTCHQEMPCIGPCPVTTPVKI
ncbi:hypothetical protein DPMN_141155 [Dreissena polymorpha]|uniref:Uncharacterized protein n=1 Tax=Dreissena polymorpha TaxID=45954 RepID=A0A9D4GEW2_DREPO|nr:hypothetical protein DPMN_141155 [Dreissena polymorpha]